MRVSGNNASEQALGAIAASAAQLLSNTQAATGEQRAAGAQNPWGPGAGGVELVQDGINAPIGKDNGLLPGRPCIPSQPSVPPIVNQLLQIIMMLLQQLGLGGHKGPCKGGAKKHAAGGGDAAGGAAPKEKLVDVGGRQAVKVDGPQGFLWKPTSDSDKKAVMLLPKEMAGKVQSAVVRDANGKEVMSGSVKGRFGDGRDIVRFPKAGEGLPPNCTIEVKLQDGTTKTWKVGDPSLRYD